MSATIRDVAKESGISVATISKYLNNGSVRPNTAGRISSAIHKLHYVPNTAARSLRMNHSMTLGILVDDITNNFYNNIISRLCSRLKQDQYSCIIQDIHEQSYSELCKTLDFVTEKQVDGLFILSSALSDEVCDALNRRFSNMVVIDCISARMNADFVLTDNLTAAYHATEQMIIRGHRRIALITGNDLYYTAKERLNGYLRALEDHDLPVCEEIILKGSYDIDGGFRAVQQLLALPADTRPSAFLSASYFLTIGAIIALNRSGCRVPQDISMICFDNYDINQIIQPPLSCIIQPVDEICRQAVESMHRRLGKTDCSEPRIFRLPAEIRITESIQQI